MYKYIVLGQPPHRSAEKIVCDMAVLAWDLLTNIYIHTCPAKTPAWPRQVILNWYVHHSLSDDCI